MDEGKTKPVGHQPRTGRRFDIARISMVLCKYAERFASSEDAPPAPAEPDDSADDREQSAQPVYQPV